MMTNTARGRRGSAATAALLAAVLLAAGCGRGPEVTVLFDKAPAIRSGDAVVLDNLAVGEVREVDATASPVKVRVRFSGQRTASPIPSKSILVVERDDATGAARLTVHVLDPRSAPVRNGDVLEGADSKLELTLRQGAAVASKFFSQLRSHTEELEQTLQELARDERVQELGQRLNDLAAELDRINRDPEGQRRKLEELGRQLEAAARELSAKGLEDAARKLRRRFEEVAAELERRTEGTR